MAELQDKIAEIKAAWGIAGDAFDKKLQRLVESSGGNPTAEALATFFRSQLQPSNIEFRLLAVGTELKAFVDAGFKSVPKKNRSALA